MVCVCVFRDNPETDIYGGNLYSRYLKKRHAHRVMLQSSASSQGTSIKTKLRRAQSDGEFIDEEEEEVIGSEEHIHHIDKDASIEEMSRQLVVEEEEDTSGQNGIYTRQCESILVCTGVFSKEMDLFNLKNHRISNHNHRDFVIDPDLKQPSHIVSNVLEAVRLVMEHGGAITQNPET